LISEIAPLWGILLISAGVELLIRFKLVSWEKNRSFRGKNSGVSSGLTLGSTLLPFVWLCRFSHQQSNVDLYYFWSSLLATFHYLTSNFIGLAYLDQTISFYGFHISLLGSVVSIHNSILKDAGVNFSSSIGTIITFILVEKAISTIWRESFTIGEKLLVSQAISLFLWTNPSITDFLSIYQVHSQKVKESEETELMTKGVLLGVLVLISLLSPIIIVLRRIRKQKKSVSHKVLIWDGIFYISFLIIGFGIIIPCLNSLIEKNSIMWVLHFIVDGGERLYIFSFWMISLFVFTAFIYSKNKRKETSNTIIRKYFHLLALILFIPGTKYHPLMLGFCYSCSLLVLLLVETFRYSKSFPIGSSIDEFMKSFADEKDQGELILTHIYLLLGCALPLWLNADSRSGSFAPYAGLLIVGIGDAAASVIGSKFGTMKWPGSKKTIEGSLAALFSVVLASYLFAPFIGLSIEVTSLDFLKFVLATILAVLMEALSDQVDNLVLPLYYFGNILLCSCRVHSLHMLDCSL